jgi:signal transduction histidine kinase
MDESLTIYYGMMVVILTFVILATGFVIIFLNYQKRILFRKQQVHEMEIQHKHDLLHECLRSAEAERLRIARDIHDEIGGIFSTLILSINTQSAQQPAPHFSKMKEVAEAGLKNVRRISHSIIPFELEILGLDETLKNYVSDFAELSQIEVDYTASSELKKLNSNQQLSVYRIVQELFSNCLKHAFAHRVALSIAEGEQELKIVYSDDGVGMPASQEEGAKGVGLKNIESRVLALNGTLSFDPAPDKGFRCSLHFPL